MTDRLRTPRTLMIPDHVWTAYEQMAGDMGSDRDGLVSQALFAFARLNGYLIPSDLQRLGLSAPPPAHAPELKAAPELMSAPEISKSAPAPEPKAPEPKAEAPRRAAPPPRLRPSVQAAGSGPATIMMDEAPRPPRPAANAGRMAEIERQLQEAPPSGMRVPASGTGNIEVDDALLGDDGVLATSMELPNLRELGLSSGERKPAPKQITSQHELGAHGVEIASTPTLVISADGRELDRVIKERFLIGRGKHCDLIINSGKVSREHAAITREGSDYFIEDLGSSNGTWFDKRRITKRQIQEGDEYFICAEKLACSFG